MTLDVYAGLFANDLDAVVERLVEAMIRRDADSMRTAGRGLTVLELGKGVQHAVD